eukprot:jgi/Pico_ML_1/55241/g966.t1
MVNSGGNRRATRSTVVSAVMDAAAEAVLQRSSEVEDGTPHVEGYAFEEEETDYNKLLESMSILYLVKNRMVDVLVTTAGGVEEDFIKCMAKTYLGDFNMRGKELREKGMNRIGNLIVPNDNYCKFEDWFVPILDRLLLEQEEDGVAWTPSKSFIG